MMSSAVVVYMLYYCQQKGADSGRHSWCRWRDGPLPQGTKNTQAISIYDLVLLSIESLPDQEPFWYCEMSPDSERCTRVLGKYLHFHFSTTYKDLRSPYCRGES